MFVLQHWIIEWTLFTIVTTCENKIIIIIIIVIYVDDWKHLTTWVWLSSEYATHIEVPWGILLPLTIFIMTWPFLFESSPPCYPIQWFLSFFSFALSPTLSLTCRFIPANIHYFISAWTVEWMSVFRWICSCCCCFCWCWCCSWCCVVLVYFFNYFKSFCLRPSSFAVQWGTITQHTKTTTTNILYLIILKRQHE